MSRNILIGVGNLLFSDDGVGVIAASYLKKNFSFSGEFEVLDGGTLGFSLLEYFTNYDNVFIVDTVSVEDDAGSVYKIPSEELLGLGAYKKTAHEVEVVQMLEACELYDKKANVTIFGVVPYDIQSVKIGLSKEVIKSFDSLIETIINAVKELDVKVTKTNDVSLNDVIKELNH